MIHKEISKALEMEGVATTLIFAGRKKTEGNPFEPLTEEAKASIQALVDEQYDIFVKAVARGRGVKASDVRGGFGEGGVVGAKEAVSLGMADRIATMDAVLGGGKRTKKGIRAETTPGTETQDGLLPVLDLEVPVPTSEFDIEARGRRWQYATDDARTA